MLAIAPELYTGPIAVMSITHRVQSRWKNWKRVAGVLCDRRMNVNIKGKVYRTVLRPTLMYGAETWALKKAHEKKLEVAEMRICYDGCAGLRSWTR